METGELKQAKQEGRDPKAVSSPLWKEGHQEEALLGPVTNEGLPRRMEEWLQFRGSSR